MNLERLISARVLFVVSFLLGLTSIPDLAYSSSASDSEGSKPTIRYTCKSNRPTLFATGDGKMKSQLTQEIDWVISDEDNKNLVVGENKALIWVRQGLGSTSRSLSVFRYRSQRSFQQDARDIQMGEVGTSHSHLENILFEDPVFGSVHVKCLIQMEK